MSGWVVFRLQLPGVVVTWFVTGLSDTELKETRAGECRPPKPLSRSDT